MPDDKIKEAIAEPSPEAPSAKQAPSIRELYEEARRRQRIWGRRHGPNDYEWMQAAWATYQAAGEKLRLQLPFCSQVAYAYSPKERENANGGNHIQLSEPYTYKRLKREAGDTLCSKRKFWGLQPLRADRGDTADCIGCLERAERLQRALTQEKTALEAG